MQKTLSLVLGAAITLGSSLAGAQELNTSAAPASAATSTGGSVTDTSGITDHQVVTGHWGLRYFGATPLASLAATGTGAASSSVQTIGARYWLNGGLGIEAGLALGFSSGSTTSTVSTGGMTTTTSSDVPNFFGIGVQIGLPIMLAEAKHVAIHLDPYLALHYGHSAITTGDASMTNDRSLNAFQLLLGANATAELQFGFLGVPQLGLQASIGFGIQFRNNSLTETVTRNSGPRTDTTTSQSSFGLGTTVGPGYGLADIISGSLSAVWYFGGAPNR